MASLRRTLRIAETRSFTLPRQCYTGLRSNNVPHRSLSSERVIERVGEHPYGSREYRLIVPQGNLQPTTVASIHAHRNIIFGAKVYAEGISLTTACQSLLVEAVHDAGEKAEQPQAIAALHGLCEWIIQQGLQSTESSISPTIQSLTPVQLEAVRAIATGIPRDRHSFVGPGTHRDAGDAWERLAREFIQSKTAVDNADDECMLYQLNGGQLVGVELLADTKPEYLKEAGGAMARFFLL
jgi:hypothetical protein